MDSHPAAQLALRHAGRLLASSTTASVPNTLRLELWEPRPSDEGLYSCSAHSPLGQANASLEVRLEGEAGHAKPTRGGTSCGIQLGLANPALLGTGVRVTLSPSAAVPEGAPVTVTCKDPAAHPPTLYAWYHNSRWLQEGPAASLSIPAATRAHAGAYTCQVQDAQGTRSSRPTALQVHCEQGSLAGGAEDEGGWRALLGLRRGGHRTAVDLGMGTWEKKDIGGEKRDPRVL